MSKPRTGDKIKVRHIDVFTYTLDVTVMEICGPDEFIGRVESIFSDGGEITGGDILALKGRKKRFRNCHIVVH